MELIPAIDMIGGRAVRLVRGSYDQPIPTTADPFELARSWIAAGARRLHVVDLEGARAGRSVQAEQVGRLAQAARAAHAAVRIQAGGGLRDEASVERMLELGIDEVILGSAALAEPGFLAACAARWPDRVGAALDLRDGRLAVEGWLREIDDEPVAAARRLADAGASRLVVTDVQRDGTGDGPNLALLASLRQRVPDARWVASGGVSNIEHLRALAGTGVAGVIVGRALLERSLTVADALAACAPLEATA